MIRRALLELYRTGGAWFVDVDLRYWRIGLRAENLHVIREDSNGCETGPAIIAEAANQEGVAETACVGPLVLKCRTVDNAAWFRRQDELERRIVVELCYPDIASLVTTATSVLKAQKAIS